jgi:hypothetical protein
MGGWFGGGKPVQSAAAPTPDSVEKVDPVTKTKKGASVLAPRTDTIMGGNTLGIAPGAATIRKTLLGE